MENDDKGRIFTDVELAELMKGENLIKLKVGDRVRVTEGPNKGKIGTIVKMPMSTPVN